MKARYIRVSSSNQNEARQLARQHPEERLFIDKVSGTTPFQKRDQAKVLLDEVQRGNVKFLAASSIDRLGRDTIDVLSTIQYLNEKGVTLRVDNLGLESLVAGKENPTFKLIVSVLANIAEMERTTLRERQLEGIAEARKKGVYKGRVKGSKETPEQILAKYPDAVRYLKMGKSIRDVSGRCRISIGTVHKIRALALENT
jgi:DNA invertase Pin-like site-specific DNA recombinase